MRREEAGIVLAIRKVKQVFTCHIYLSSDLDLYTELLLFAEKHPFKYGRSKQYFDVNTNNDEHV